MQNGDNYVRKSVMVIELYLAALNWIQVDRGKGRNQK
jgi:hypothetical protein